MSDLTLEELIEKARKTPMTDDERREQAASFAYGNLALTKEWADASEEKLAWLRSTCRRMAGCTPVRCDACSGRGYLVSYGGGTPGWTSIERIESTCEKCLGWGEIW